MSAKSKMRGDLLHWKLLTEQADAERVQYAGLMVAILDKFGPEIVLSKENLAAVTRDHAVQTTRLGDGAVKIRLVLKTVNAHE